MGCFGGGEGGGGGGGGDNYVHEDFRGLASRHGFRIVWPAQDFQHFAPAQSAKVLLNPLAPARHTAARHG